MWYIGVDPGKTGCMACITDRDETWLIGLGRDESALAISQTLARYAQPLRVAVERSHPRPADGRVAAFTCGYNTGYVEGVLAVANVGIAYTPTPAQWKRDLGLKPCKTRAERKKESVALAWRMFPQAMEDASRRRDILSIDGAAEALLIAEWVRRKENGS